MAAENKGTATPADSSATDEHESDSAPSQSVLSARPPPQWDDDDDGDGEERTEMQMDAELVARARHRLLFGRAKPGEGVPGPPAADARRVSPDVTPPPAAKPAPVATPAPVPAGAVIRPPAMRAATKIGMPMPADGGPSPVARRVGTQPPPRPPGLAKPAQPAVPAPPPRNSVPPPRMSVPPPRLPVASPSVPRVAMPAPGANDSSASQRIPAVNPVATESGTAEASHRRPVADANEAASTPSDVDVPVGWENPSEDVPPMAAPPVPNVAPPMPQPAARPSVAPRPAVDATGARVAMRRRVRRSRVEWAAIAFATVSVLWAIWLLLFYRR